MTRFNVLLSNIRRMVALTNEPLNSPVVSSDSNQNAKPTKQQLLQKDLISIQDHMIDDISQGLTKLHHQVWKMGTISQHT